GSVHPRRPDVSRANGRSPPNVAIHLGRPKSQAGRDCEGQHRHKEGSLTIGLSLVPLPSRNTATALVSAGFGLPLPQHDPTRLPPQLRPRNTIAGERRGRGGGWAALAF